MKSVWLCAALVAGGLLVAAPGQAAPSFKADVLPIFQEHCAMCHGPGGVGNSSAALDLTTYKGVRSGSIGGVVVIPFHPERSKLIKTVKDNWASGKGLKMPPMGQQLTPKEIETISAWIKEGAKND